MKTQLNTNTLQPSPAESTPRAASTIGASYYRPNLPLRPADVSSFAEDTLDSVADYGCWWHKIKTGSPIANDAREIGTNTIELISDGAVRIGAKAINMVTGALDVAEAFYVDRDLEGGSGVGTNFKIATGKAVLGAALGSAVVFLGVGSAPFSLGAIVTGLAISAGTKFALDAAESYLRSH